MTTVILKILKLNSTATFLSCCPAMSLDTMQIQFCQPFLCRLFKNNWTLKSFCFFFFLKNFLEYTFDEPGQCCSISCCFIVAYTDRFKHLYLNWKNREHSYFNGIFSYFKLLLERPTRLKWNCRTPFCHVKIIRIKQFNVLIWQLVILAVCPISDKKHNHRTLNLDSFLVEKQSAKHFKN